MLADVIPRIAAELQAAPSEYTERPSSAGPERCIRQMVYHASGIPRQPFPGRAILVFDDSSWHEELTKDWIRKSAFTLHSEQMPVNLPGVFPWRKGERRSCAICEQPIRAKYALPPDLDDLERERRSRALQEELDRAKIPAEDLHGHPDGLLTDLARIDRLLEHKAINHFSYDRIWKGDWPLDNLTQTAIYTRAVQELAPELREALLLLKNKNTSAYMEMLCDYDRDADLLTIREVLRSDGERSAPNFQMPGVVQAAIAKFADVERYRAAATLPRRPFPYGTDFPCGYCAWAGTCWDGYEQEIQAYTTDAALEQDMVDLVGYYLQADGQAKEMKKEADHLKHRIQEHMHTIGAREARAGEYVVLLSLRKRGGYVAEPTQWEQVDIRKPKAAPAKKGRGKGAADGEADAGPGRPGAGEPDR